MEVLTRTAQRRRRRLWKKILWSSLLVIFFTFLTLSAFILYIYNMGAPSLTVPETSIVYSADGQTIGEFSQGEHRYWIPLDHMGEDILNATLAIEDRRFYTHYGFDPIRIGRAILTNLTTGTKSQGASTITQQYARNLFLSHDKTWVRKFNEALYALRLELHYTKEEILEGYLNTIYYGHGAYGIEAAANLYFQKNAEALTTAEAAMLAGIPKGPSLYSPFVDLDRATGRQQVVLNSMHEMGVTTEKEIEVSKREDIQLAEESEMTGKRIAPYFQDALRQWLVEEHDFDMTVLDGGGLTIYTTLLTDMQKEAERLITKELSLDEELETALVAIDPRTGDVRALAGGKNYNESTFNRATQAKRHPGSTLKPFLYYASLEHGLRPNSMLKSEETTFVYDEGREEYHPGNFNHRYADDYITMLQALAVSDNIYAMKTHFLLGFEDLVDTAAKFGITSQMSPVPSLALGTSDVGIMEMTSSYSPFANGGYHITPRFVEKIVDRDGNILFEAKTERIKTLDPAYTAIMTDMMKGMFEPELGADYASVTGGSISSILEDRPVAGKSGSTQSDSWMIGFTPQLVTGVWTGYDDARALEGDDAQHSKQIWALFMKKALKNDLKLSFPVPDNVVEVAINPFNGLLATEDCPISRPTLFLSGSEPSEYCTEHIDETEEHDGNNDELREKFRQREDKKKEKWLDKLFDWVTLND
jgi:1A family penicillin-binding protein